MQKIRISCELSDETYAEYQEEARRLGVTAESLVEKTVCRLLHEMEDELHQVEDHPVIPS